MDVVEDLRIMLKMSSCTARLGAAESSDSATGAPLFATIARRLSRPLASAWRATEAAHARTTDTRIENRMEDNSFTQS